MRRFSVYLILIFLCPLFSDCAGMAVSAEEYFSIGMAYYELGKYEDAEKWLNRAKAADKTMAASQYNLGRLAFERQRYHEAAGHFEDILKKDPNNVLALKAAAYTRIKTGDIEIAEKYYGKLLELVPESADDGYNHALVLYAMEHYEETEKVLEKYPYAIEENNEVLLLYARSQKAMNKVEAIDNYAKWLNVNSDAKVRFEYAGLLEQQELYARALEEYRKIISENDGSDSEPKQSDVRFALARLLLIADSESGEGITELETAVREGFNDIDAVRELLDSGKAGAVNTNSLTNIINNMQRASEAAEQLQSEKNETGAINESQENFSQTGSEDSSD